MTSYPELPSASAAPFDPKEGANAPARPESAQAEPELPSKWWPLLLVVIGIITVALQSSSLLTLLDSGRKQAEFDARVAAWDESTTSRQDAIQEWSKIENEVRGRVEELRSQSQQIAGLRDTLETEHNQLSKTVASETKNVEVLRKERDTIEISLKAAKESLQSAENQQSSLQAQLKSIQKQIADSETENDSLIAKGRSIQTALRRIKATREIAEKSLQSEEGRLAEAEAKVTATDKELKRLESLLSDRASALASFKQQQVEAQAATEKVEQAREQLTILEQQLKKLGAERDTATVALAALKSEADGVTKTTSQEASRLSQLKSQIEEAEKALAAKRLAEEQVAQRLSEMSETLAESTRTATEALKKITSSASETIVELSQRAEEAKRAIEKLRDTPPVPPAPSESAGTAEEEGGS